MSEIRVDTISEKTSANGVAIDGVTIKDGGIAATLASTITTADNTDTLSLISTDADATQGPVLNLYRNSSSPANDDDIARINFTGNDSGGNATTYATIRAVIGDVTDGSEDMQILHQQIIGGTNVNTIRIKPDEIVLNDSSIDLDFRVESNDVDKMLFVNGGTNSVSIGGEATPLGRLHVITADSGSSAHANADEFVIEGSAYSGMTIASGTSSHGTIAFADSGDELAGRIIYNHSTNAMSFGTAGTGTQWSINSDGNLLPGASTGQGIHLGVTSAGAANLLDDYEEGTWTIVLEDHSDNAITLSTNEGTYIKIGGQVTITGYLVASALESASGAIRISGLPFNILGNARNYAAMTIGYAAGLDITAGTSIAGIGIINTANVNIVNFDVAAGSTNLTAAKFSADGQFIFTMTYTVV